MEIGHAHTLFQLPEEQRTCFLFRGDLEDPHTARLIDLGEALAWQLGGTAVRKGKLAFVMVEAYQNIVRHRPTGPTGADPREKSCFMLFMDDLGAQVVAVNPMPESDVAGLEQALHEIEGKNGEQLKGMFLEGLRASGPTRKGGAGLGLIEMARRSGHPLLHAMDPLGKGLSRFMLQVGLGDPRASRSLSTARWLQELAEKEGLRLMYRGPSLPAVLEAVMGIVQHMDADVRRGEDRRRTFLAITQFFEDMDIAADEPVLFALSKGPDGERMTLGCERPSARARELLQELDRLHGLSPIGMRAHYRALIARAGGRGAGAAELVQRGREGVGVDLRELSGDRTFIALQVLI
ncbi:MAG: hypothetical protein KDB97_09345 [Flavobacteriales bacterium]|nr:hypothetical protein [Flavobacteriales bacterium]